MDCPECGKGMSNDGTVNCITYWSCCDCAVIINEHDCRYRKVLEEVERTYRRELAFLCNELKKSLPDEVREYVIRKRSFIHTLLREFRSEKRRHGITTEGD